MPKKKNRRSEWSARQLALGGQQIPLAVQRRILADAKNRLDAIDRQAFDRDKMRLRREAQKYRNKVVAPPNLKDPQVARAAEQMRRFAVGISRKKLVVPSVTAATAGILDAGYSLRLAPKYDFASVSTFPEFNFAGTGFAHRNNGVIGVTAMAAGTRQALVRARVGSFFIPMFGAGTLRATASPAFSFAWTANALGAQAFTTGKMSFAILSYRRNGDGDASAVAVDSRMVWFVDGLTGVQFDFALDAGTAMTVSAKVDSEHFYLVSLSCEALAFLNGSSLTPMHLASGALNATLPYIDLDVRLRPNVVVASDT